MERFRVDAFLAGVAVGALGYLLCRSFKTRKESIDWASFWYWNQRDVSKEEKDQAIEFYFADPEAYVPLAADLNVRIDQKQSHCLQTSQQFAYRCAVLCEKYSSILQDFTGEAGESTCLDIGCSVGATTFQLGKWCFPPFDRIQGVT